MKNVTIVMMMSVFCLSASAIAGGTGLSKEEVAKIKRYYLAKGTGDGDTYVVNADQLKGAAKAQYNRRSRSEECTKYGYCPEAYSINAYGTETVAVGVQDDGGQTFVVYTADGKHEILSCSAGESEDLSCSE